MKAIYIKPGHYRSSLSTQIKSILKAFGGKEDSYIIFKEGGGDSINNQSTALTSLLYAVKKGEIHEVYIVSLSKLSMDEYLLRSIRNTLRKHKVKLFTSQKSLDLLNLTCCKLQSFHRRITNLQIHVIVKNHIKHMEELSLKMKSLRNVNVGTRMGGNSFKKYFKK